MSMNHDKKLDELLDRHVDALRAEAADETPPPELIAKAQRNLVREPHRPNFAKRLINMTFAQRIAAVVMITLGALTLYLVFGLFNTLAPTLAFADVVQKFKSARTMTFTNTITLPGMPPVKSRTLVAEPSRMRTEMSQIVTITDGRTFLTLQPGARTAERMEMTGTTTAPVASGGDGMLGALRRLGADKSRPMGEKVINGVTAQGFAASVGQQTMTVWADKKTALPLRVETTIPGVNGDTLVVMDEFQMDVPLDDSLFSLDPPPGYTLKTRKMELPAIGKPEDMVVDLLREYAAHSEGAFPAQIENFAGFQEVVMKVDEATRNKLIGRIGATSAIVRSRAPGYQYAGKGARLGEKDKIIFWYRPKDSATYRGVFGDLRIEDLTPDRIPATQPATKP
jgi:outer membrane lipoprotein-sorting protein